MPHQAKKHELNIVLRGNFNPAIFNPTWLSVNGLIGDQAAEASNIEFMYPNASVFTTGEFRFSVTPDRFQAGTNQDSHRELLIELVLGTFILLGHTPVSAMGINTDAHYQLPSEDEWNALGDLLAPKEGWDILENPGLQSLTMQGNRPDSHSGYIHVLVQPSRTVSCGLYVRVNDHFDTKKNEGAGAHDAMEILKNEWAASLSRSESIERHLVNLRGG